jgi:hypothetical protein
MRMELAKHHPRRQHQHPLQALVLVQAAGPVSLGWLVHPPLGAELVLLVLAGGEGMLAPRGPGPPGQLQPPAGSRERYEL